MEKESVIRELGRIAFGEASDAAGAEVKMASKLRALELLGKHFGLFDKTATEGDAPVVIVDDLGDGLPRLAEQASQ